jgi:very-short-patch-repair endonuclease
MHTGDRAIAALAARQHGMVTTRQLAAAGLGRRAVAHRVATGRLVRRFRGVYQVGPVLAPFGREMAAVLACGATALLSHHSAAAIWAIRPHHDGDVHVAVAGHDQRSRPGLRLHRSLALIAAVHDGLPLTTPARTLLDLATVLPQHQLDRATEEAQVLRLTTREELQQVLDGRPGSAALRRALHTEPALTRSEAERRLLDLVRAARLPRPETNVVVAGHEVDLLWREHKLIVEVDGFAYHATRNAFERDRARDATLQAAGHRVIRLTWRRIAQEPHAVVARLASLMPPSPA